MRIALSVSHDQVDGILWNVSRRRDVSSERNSSDKVIRSLPFWVAFLYTLIAPAAAIALHSVEAAGVLTVAGVVALLAVRLPDLVRFKGFGLEAELKERIDRADEVLAQLRKLAVAIAEPTLSMFAVHHYFSKRLSRRHLYFLRERINVILAEIGVDQPAVQNTNEVYDEHLIRHLQDDILTDAHQDKPNATEQIQIMRNKLPVSPQELEQFLQQHDVPSETWSEGLKEVRHFVEYRKLRNTQVLSDDEDE